MPASMSGIDLSIHSYMCVINMVITCLTCLQLRMLYSKIYCGYIFYFYYMLKELLSYSPDGIIWTAGENDRGQLGHHGTQDRPIFSPVENIPPAKQLATGNYHGVILTRHGKVIRWPPNNVTYGCHSHDPFGGLVDIWLWTYVIWTPDNSENTLFWTESNHCM